MAARLAGLTSAPAVFAACFLVLIAATPGALFAQRAADAERQKIEALITRIGELTGVAFVRNGSTYNAASAVRFLRQKWIANDGAITTAREFIDKVASVSGSSGKPYLIRFPDGREITSRDYLLKELTALDTAH